MESIVILLLVTIIKIVSTLHNETVIDSHNWRNITTTTQIVHEEAQAKLYMTKLNDRLEVLINSPKNAGWNFETDINAANEAKLLIALAKYDQDFALENIGEKFGQLKNYKQYKDESLVREMDKYLAPSDKLRVYGDDGRRYDNISTQMKKIYSSATVCLTQNETTVKCKFELEPDLTNLMARSRDFDRLKEVWTKWRNSSGKPIRALYKEYIKLRNKTITMRGLNTQEDLWSLGWQSSNFKSQVDQLWREVEPYYKKLHAYVRMKLRRFYGVEKMPKDGTIPAHLLGNMWAQTWENIYELVAPFPGKKSQDIGKAMRAQNYTPLMMFQLADKFFTDLGLMPVPAEFWNKSIIEKPTDERKMSCHPSSFDFYNKQDFRIKMCTKVSLEDLLVVHHEMGHIQYYLQYRNQPVIFRYSANGGFHEAIGDLMALSVSTPSHLAKINLISNYTEDEEVSLNHQMKMALHKIAFLPFTYLLDGWRWDLHLDAKLQENMNRHWWWHRLHTQGISPSVVRNEADFDAGAKYHVAYSTDYIRYFVSVIIQFQFHKSLCQIAQPSVPMHQCDIDGNRQVGDRLARMMALGSSREWTHAMKLMTGSEEMSAKPLIEYFAPLFKWIDRQLVGEKVGWTVDVDRYIENSTK